MRQKNELARTQKEDTWHTWKQPKLSNLRHGCEYVIDGAVVGHTNVIIVAISMVCDDVLRPADAAQCSPRDGSMALYLEIKVTFR